MTSLNMVTKLKGTVVLMKKNALNYKVIGGNTVVENEGDTVRPTLLDTSVGFKLISASKADATGKGKVGKETFMDGFVTSIPNLGDIQNAFSIHFEWDPNHMGIPGAFYVKNFTQDEIFLVSLTLEDVESHETTNFICNSWIYNAEKYQTERIFFANKAYLPSQAPQPLVYYIKEELKTLRGDGTGERKVWDRIYDYDVYNDLGQPDESPCLYRPVLGGSAALPYPRRGRTGRKRLEKYPETESRSGYFYIPRDELIIPQKSSDFVVNTLKLISQHETPQLRSLVRLQNDQPEFNSFDEVLSLFAGEHPDFPTPLVIREDRTAWMTDEEFAREIIAGVNPNVIKKVEDTTTINKKHLEPYMQDGVNVEQTIKALRLYVVDYQDAILPYLRKINATGAKAYASTTLLSLQDDGTLKPISIELHVPHPDGDGIVTTSYTPATEGVDASIWRLAKAYAVVNDACYHQLISHWLHTHASVEPFIIATNRHLSVVHPIHKLLLPHYRNTMNINANARDVLIKAGGIIESTYLFGSYSMELSSDVYKDWVFPDQALPNDLIKRGVAVKDPKFPHGVRLLIEDYPYATDGLEIWAAIKSWVEEYVNFYYKLDAAVADDSELQAFWKELVEVGHGDLKDATWWFKMKTRAELIETCTTLIWMASALHAAVNFGQYPYGGYIVNRPTKSRRFMPEKGTPEYDELAQDFEKAYLRTITPLMETRVNMSVMEQLSSHVSDEQYIGHRIEGDLWTYDSEPVEAFKKFGKKLAEIEQKLIERNNDESLRNRNGPVKMPYTVLYPSSEPGLTFRGIPNSVSI
ncbi:putative linoleate 9S-lipoxygenase [Medicago truncatula]|uniref:Lipoxygenase n=1 Tax=Medicago truncatula TaxID=3880 RepID=G7LIY9_MEDTR|nr:linoleate 9S-lipoxygenase isoform X1 [Medicago truncatula]AET01670.1 seed linoleate 9S-lipoxygenase [Medicago truncatula]RHN39363.1 putative linoleate 9S-lipoxygenase [Medicago truncatula]